MYIIQCFNSGVLSIKHIDKIIITAVLVYSGLFDIKCCIENPRLLSKFRKYQLRQLGHSESSDTKGIKYSE